MLFVFLILQIIAFKLYSGQVCTWPEDFVDSTWIDSLKGDMVFSSTTMSGWSFDVNIQASASVQTLDSWACVSQNSPYLIMKTTETFTQFFTLQYTGYRCIILEKITELSYRYYQTEPMQTELENERVFIDQDDSITDPSILCQFPSTGAEFQVMIKKGYETSAKVVCPYSLLADYTFTYSQSDGTVTCDAVSDQGAIYMCTNVTEISVQSPVCSPYPLYSNANSSWCVDVVTVGSDTFVSLYNDQQDSSIPNTYQFVCVGINSEGTSMSVTPQHCKADQLSTEIPADNSGNNVGAVWSLSISADPCPPCPTLSEPFQGSVNVSTNGAITIATYGCDDTYTLSGNDTRICQANGDWSDSAPSCTCPIPSSLSNGNVDVTNGGLTVTFTCNTGYVLVGTSSSLACNIVTNNWSDAYPTCEECETLLAPSGGSVTITSDGLTSFATYKCDTGTTLNGGSSRTCNTDTTWTNAAPTCISTTTPVPSESKSDNSSLLPAVIALSIITVGLGIAFVLSVCYIWKLKKNAQGYSKKTNENGTASYLFPASKAPLDHSQHVMDFRNTSSAMSSAPWSHHPSPRVDSITPRSLSTTVSSNSLHLSHLNLIREDTASSVILDQNNPAPWIRRPKHEHGTSLSTGPFPPINESGTGLTTPRGNDDTGQKHMRKKKRSFTKKMQSQNSVHASETEASDNEQMKSRVVKSDSMKQRSQRRMMVNRNASTSNIKGTAINGGIVVPKLKLSEQPTRASTPVKHQIEVRDPDQCRTPRSNTFSTVQ